MDREVSKLLRWQNAGPHWKQALDFKEHGEDHVMMVSSFPSAAIADKRMMARFTPALDRSTSKVISELPTYVNLLPNLYWKQKEEGRITAKYLEKIDFYH